MSEVATSVRVLRAGSTRGRRLGPPDVAFPNLDLTAHLLREPVGEWTGFDAIVSFGADGVGVTSSILHDEQRPLGSMAQTLTVRPTRTA